MFNVDSVILKLKTLSNDSKRMREVYSITGNKEEEQYERGKIYAYNNVIRIIKEEVDQIKKQHTECAVL